MLRKISCIIIHSFRTPFPFVKCHCLRLIVFFFRKNILNCFNWLQFEKFIILGFSLFIFFLNNCVDKNILLQTFDKMPKGERKQYKDQKLRVRVFALIIFFNFKRKCQSPLRKFKMYQKDCYIRRQFTILFELLIPSTKDTNGRYRNNHVIWISWHQWLLRILTDRLTR